MSTPVPEIGCWVDGHWGQYASARLVELAKIFGYDDEKIIDLAARHMDECTHGGIATRSMPLTGDEMDELVEGADEAIGWLSEHIAPEGTSFGWQDGEVFLQTEEWWEDDG